MQQRLSQGQTKDRYLIGLHVSELRYISGVGQKQLIKYLKLSRTGVLSRREHGVTDFTAAELGAVSILFDLPIAWFFEPVLDLPEPRRITVFPEIDLEAYNREMILRLREIRRAHNITQGQIAALLGYSTTAWTYVESEERPIKGWELWSISQFFKINPFVLFKQGEIRLPKIEAPAILTKINRLKDRKPIQFETSSS